MAIQEQLDMRRDTRSDKEKRSDIGGALLLAGSVAGIVIARRKLAITRGISKEILGAGLGGESRYGRYLSSEARKVKSPKAKTIRESITEKAETIERIINNPVGYAKEELFKHDLFKPIPSDEESYQIAISYLRKHLNNEGMDFPEWSKFGKRESSQFHKILRGPRVAAFAPGSTMGKLTPEGRQVRVGQHGAILIDQQLHMLTGASYGQGGLFSNIAKGKYKLGIVGLRGGAYERRNRGLVVPVNPKNEFEFIRDIDIGHEGLLELERRSFLKKEYVNRFFHNVSIPVGSTSKDIEDIIGKHLRDMQGDVGLGASPTWRNPMTGESEFIPTPWQFMQKRVSSYEYGDRGGLTFEEKLLADVQKTKEQIAIKHKGSSITKARFAAFKLGRKLGISEEFSSYGAGFPQKAERWIRSGAGWNYRYPGTGEILPVEPRRYTERGSKLGSDWRHGEGPWYITDPRSTFYRNLNVHLTGTLHRVLEHATGIGVSNKHSAASSFVANLLKAKSGSHGDAFIRGINQTGRAMILGFGAYYAYKAVNDVTRSTIGWGPNDLLADTYVRAREFQQRVLKDTGISSVARVVDTAFPGSISSPAGHAIRLLSPIFLANFFGKRHGPAGFRAGLAAGIAFALITWGDITQSPEELHRIFTGEQDIPVRSGRYWLLGSTPFFGGKISYWRPHWYPLMRSGYQYQGQLWDSKREQWAQGSPFSPVLAPVLTGHRWDPYYWEKKHYQDRPYLLSGELFEPTMPFASIGNLTIGNIIKPPRLMHKEYLGAEQINSSEQERGIPPNVGASLGFPSLTGAGVSGGVSPFTLRHQAGLAAYSQIEQMGLTGFAASTLWQRITGQQNFQEDNSVIQTSRRATGYERGYWQKELGDPGAGLDEGLTEYFRRFLPHRRRDVEEYNPIPNKMPDWLPGEDYFTNFRQGDPYVKIPYGEARLPGGGYESLNELHSGIHGVYDTVDRFIILADVAPYSNEYRRYRSSAIAMTRGDPYWSLKVSQAIAQRDELTSGIDFLSFKDDNVPFLLRPFSSAYKHILSGIENIANPLDLYPMRVVKDGYPAHINKWISNETPETEYRNYQLYGAQYAGWDKPLEGFVFPFLRKTRSEWDRDYVPKSVQKRRDIQEYFDKLKYIKYTNLAQLARDMGNNDLATKFSSSARHTMAAGQYNEWAAMGAIPKEEKPYFKEFSSAEGERREEILKLVPDYMKNYYMTAWNKADGKQTYNVSHQSSKDLVNYFKNHYMPAPDWTGWNPDIDVDQIKLKTVKNEGMDIHSFNLWESNERQLSRQPFTPLIKDINAPSDDIAMLQNTIVSNMEKLGFTNNKVYITRTPSDRNSHKIRMRVKKDNSEDEDMARNNSLSSISG